MRVFVLCLLFLGAASGPIISQTFKTVTKTITTSDSGKTMVRIEGGAFIPELGAALGEDNKEVKVVHAMPANARPKKYADVDVQANDLVLMVNAKPLRSVEAFRKLYDAASPGDTITLGIRRGEQLHLAPFVKMDPKDMPKDRKIIIKKRD
jgi:S1-C subfamily serine protease